MDWLEIAIASTSDRGIARPSRQMMDTIRVFHDAEVERVKAELKARVERLEEAVKQSLQALEEAERALTAINKWCFNQGGGMITGHRARIFNYIGDRPEKCRTAIFNLKAIL